MSEPITEPITEPDADERNMPIFARCHDLLRWLVPCVQDFPRAQRHLLAQRVLDTAFDVQEALVRARKADCAAKPAPRRRAAGDAAHAMAAGPRVALHQPRPVRARRAPHGRDRAHAWRVAPGSQLKGRVRRCVGRIATGTIPGTGTTTWGIASPAPLAMPDVAAIARPEMPYAHGRRPRPKREVQDAIPVCRRRQAKDEPAPRLPVALPGDRRRGANQPRQVP